MSGEPAMTVSHNAVMLELLNRQMEESPSGTPPITMIAYARQQRELRDALDLISQLGFVVAMKVPDDGTA